MKTVLALLQIYSPNRPYCTDDLRLGVQIRGRSQALQCTYTQLNPPAFRYWLICDVDRAGAAFAAQDAGLPDPSWITITRENRHAHLMWALETPVYLAENGSKTAMRYLMALEACYSDLVGADVGYGTVV